jgi:hypothetical protein
MSTTRPNQVSKRETYLVQFIADNLQIACTRIRLTQLGNKSPKVYEAAGTLRLGKSFGMECDLLVPAPGTTIHDAFAFLRDTSREEVGQLIPEDQHFQLEAVEEDGTVWTHPALTLGMRTLSGAYKLSFSARYLENVAKVDDLGYACRLTYIEDLSLPNNLVVDEPRPDGSHFIGRDGSTGRLSNLDLTYRRIYMASGGHRVELEVRAENDTLPFHVDSRLVETLQFCTAVAASPICTEVAHGSHRSILLMRHKPAPRGLVLPPQQGSSADRCFYQLATVFYEHSCLAGDHERLSPLFAKICSIFELGAASVAPIALLLCVAVESLSQAGQLSGLTIASPEHKKVVTDALAATLANKAFPELAERFEKANTGVDRRTLAARLMALFPMMSQGGRTKDVLTILKEAGAVTTEEIRAWDQLRHPSAHGSWELKEDSFQVDLDKMYKVLTLVYRMVFFHIGYQGEFTNRGERGWPSGKFDGKAAQAHIVQPPPSVKGPMGAPA